MMVPSVLATLMMVPSVFATLMMVSVGPVGPLSFSGLAHHNPLAQLLSLDLLLRDEVMGNDALHVRRTFSPSLSRLINPPTNQPMLPEMGDKVVIGPHVTNPKALISNVDADMVKTIAEAARFVRVISPSIEVLIVTEPAIAFIW